MIERNLKKDWQNSREELELLKLVVDQKFKLEKLRIELLMPCVLPKLLLLKVSCQEEELLYSMPQKNSTNLLSHLQT